MAKCSCGAEIVWARSLKGARIPLQKVSGHAYVIVGERPLPKAPLPKAVPIGYATWRNHSLTCPDRARYSGRGRDKAKK